MKRTIFSALLAGLALVLAQNAGAQDSTRAFVPTVGGPQYFAVLVSDADKSAQWYRTTFGLRELDRSAAEDGSWQIVNLASDQLFVEIIRDNRAQHATRARGFFKVGFHVPDVEVVADVFARTTGVRPRVLDFPRHGVRIVQVRDPDANIIQLFSQLRR
jgi:catechol 2,3-dioxygenase-like lactoylglutathione lyase family enzyme